LNEHGTSIVPPWLLFKVNSTLFFWEFMLTFSPWLEEVSENWDDDFEFQIEKRKLSTATANSVPTENWDDDFEDSHQSPKKIIQRHREESWDEDEDEDDDDDENGEFSFFADEDRTVTTRSRRAALAKLSTPHPPRSPASSVFSVPTTIHTYSSTALLRPTILPPSPIHKERERRRLRKKSRPKPQGIFELVEIHPQDRPSFSDVDLPPPPSRSASRRTTRSDIFVDTRPPANPVGNSNSTFYSMAPNASRSDLSEHGESSLSRRMSGKGKASGTGYPTLTTMVTPTKLVKRKTFGFVHLGREAGVEKEKEDSPKGKQGSRSFMGSVRRISLVSVGVVGRHKKSKSGVGGDSLAHIPPVPTSLPPDLSCPSQVSLRIPTTCSSPRYPSSHSSTADLRRAASLPFPHSPTASPVRSNSGTRPPSTPSSAKRRRRTLSKSKSKPRKSEESAQDFRDRAVKASLDFEQARLPFCDPSEGTDTTPFKTPTRSTFAAAAAALPIPLLPPIELQPPSPPHTATTSHKPRRYTTNEPVEGLELKALVLTPTTSAYFTPTSSPSRPNVGTVGGILPLPPLSPTKLSSGKSPSQSHQSVSLGRSTAVSGGGGGDESTGSGGAGGIPRRNSLGDLKIPAKISQAQVGLRRDLGMVREFASNVEREFCLLRFFPVN
jgi:hypothetical protein